MIKVLAHLMILIGINIKFQLRIKKNTNKQPTQPKKKKQTNNQRLKVKFKYHRLLLHDIFKTYQFYGEKDKCLGYQHVLIKILKICNTFNTIFKVVLCTVFFVINDNVNCYD